jgi:c-di-GMP-related signal transduction protein
MITRDNLERIIAKSFEDNGIAKLAREQMFAEELQKAMLQIVDDISKCNNDLIIRDIHEDTVTVFNPDSSILVVTNNQLCINDLLLQIKEKQLEGYTIKRDNCDDIHEITPSGHILGPGYANVYASQLDTLFLT